MEINLKGGLATIGLVALSGYVFYLKGRSDAIKEIHNERSEMFKAFNRDNKTRKRKYSKEETC